jgi:hypothetical protein
MNTSIPPQPGHNGVTFYLQRLERAAGRLAGVLTEIDSIVRVVHSKPDMLGTAITELGFIERSLSLTLSRIGDAKRLRANLLCVDEWQEWPAKEEVGQ